jgi:hypothetical protein
MIEVGMHWLVRFLVLASVATASTMSPSAAPTSIPTPVFEAPASDIPIAMHQLVVVENAGNSLIRLKSFEINNFNVS